MTGYYEPRPQEQPMLVALIRRDPGGDVVHKPSSGPGSVACSGETFLYEYDRAIAAAEQRGREGRA